MAWAVDSTGSESSGPVLEFTTESATKDRVQRVSIAAQNDDTLYFLARVFFSSDFDGTIGIGAKQFAINGGGLSEAVDSTAYGDLTLDAWQTLRGSITLSNAGSITSVKPFLRGTGDNGTFKVSKFFMSQNEINATVGAKAGTNLIASDGTPLGDAEVITSQGTSNDTSNVGGVSAANVLIATAVAQNNLVLNNNYSYSYTDHFDESDSPIVSASSEGITAPPYDLGDNVQRIWDSGTSQFDTIKVGFSQANDGVTLSTGERVTIGFWAYNDDTSNISVGWSGSGGWCEVAITASTGWTWYTVQGTADSATGDFQVRRDESSTPHDGNAYLTGLVVVRGHVDLSALSTQPAMPTVDPSSVITSLGTANDATYVNGVLASIVQGLTAKVIEYSSKTATNTMGAFEGVFADTSGGSFTQNLPASPALGDICIIQDSANSWDTNPLTIGRNDESINGAADDLNCNLVKGNGIGFELTLQFLGGSIGWKVYFR